MNTYMKKIGKNKSNSYGKDPEDTINLVSASTGEVKERDLLEEKLDYLERRQLVSESTATDWVVDFENRLHRLEKEDEELNNEKERLKNNIDLLSEIGQLQDNWNQYGSEKFKQELVFKCIKIIIHTDLIYQPEIFPTARQSIQFEYEPDDNHYLEIEIFEDKIKLYCREDENIRKIANLSIEETINEINEFQSQF